MREVSCRALDVFVRGLKKRKLDPALLTAGVDLPLSHLVDKNERVDWDDFRRVVGNVSKILNQDEIVALGRDIHSPGLAVFSIIGTLLYTTLDFYRFILNMSSGAGSVMCTNTTCELESIDPTHLRATISVVAPYEPCVELFLVSKGAMTEIPTIYGFPPAQVEMTLRGRSAVFDIRYTQGGGALGWVRKALTWPFTVRAAAKELQDAHSTLQTRYFELDAAQHVVANQATQLQTAHTISQVVHADLDLGRTLEAVAEAFVSIAHFRGAEVSLTGGSERQAIRGLTEGEPNLVRALEARGRTTGQLKLWFGELANSTERVALADMALPTVAMALHGAVTHAELLDAQAHLERRVEERTVELVMARDQLAETVEQLREAEAARSRIFSNINHEIRTPLTLILLSVEQLRRDTRFDEATQRVLGGVARNARKLLRLIDALLLLAAGDERKLVIRARKLDVAQLTTEVVEGFAASANVAGLKLRAEIPSPVEAEVDEPALERILSNLISNAIKFTPRGGEIVVRLAHVGDQFELAVRDTGVGISDEFAGRIFGRFEQGRKPAQPDAPGSGLGLALVRELARAHGGDAVVERPAVGSVFRVNIPLRSITGVVGEEPPARSARSVPSDFGLAIEAPIPAATPQGESREHWVLVVEDDPELRARIVEILGSAHHVIEAADAERALDLIRERRPDMMVSDIGLPGMDGLELTRRFRAMPENRLAPVLLLTAFGAIEQRLSGFDAGAVDYMTKPFDAAELGARVHAHLDRRRLALRLHENEKLAALGTMSAGLAHEIRNPANGIVNAIEPLISLLPPELRDPDTGVAQLLEVIKDCAAQIGLLSRQLLGYQRDDVATERVFANKLVERSLGILAGALKGRELRLDLRFPAQIECAAALMLQVLSNLIENAAYAAGANGWVSISTFAEGGRFVCEVGDSGAGVPPALREKIFEPFFTTKPPGQGTGLGLSTARSILRTHGGSLAVRAHGETTVFRLELPQAEGPASAQSAQSSRS